MLQSPANCNPTNQLTWSPQPGDQYDPFAVFADITGAGAEAGKTVGNHVGYFVLQLQKRLGRERIPEESQLQQDTLKTEPGITKRHKIGIRTEIVPCWRKLAENLASPWRRRAGHIRFLNFNRSLCFCSDCLSSNLRLCTEWLQG